MTQSSATHRLPAVPPESASECALRCFYIGLNGHIIAVDRATGAVIWNTFIKSYAFVNIAVVGGELLVASNGEVWCLDASTGVIRWHNPLKGFGYGYVSIAVPGQQHNEQASMAAALAAQAAASRTATT